MNNQVVITFDNEDQAQRYFKRFNGINGANRIELGNKDLEKRDKLLEQASQYIARSLYRFSDECGQEEKWLKDYEELKK